MARVKKACGRGTAGVVGGAGGKVDGAGRARGTLAAMRHFVRVGSMVWVYREWSLGAW